MTHVAEMFTFVMFPVVPSQRMVTIVMPAEATRWPDWLKHTKAHFDQLVYDYNLLNDLHIYQFPNHFQRLCTNYWGTCTLGGFVACLENYLKLVTFLGSKWFTRYMYIVDILHVHLLFENQRLQSMSLLLFKKVWWPFCSSLKLIYTNYFENST